MPWEKQFDETEVLEKATRAFWAGGYEGTPMADLLEQMGIQKGSFYATFGSKHQVYLDVLERYVADRYAGTGAMAAADSPRFELEKHFRWIADDAVSDDGPMGCLVVNAAVEVAPKDSAVKAFVHRTFDRHIGLYRRVLDAAKAKGEVPTGTDTLAVARTLFALVLGIRVLSRAGMGRAVISALRDQALGLIRGNSAAGA
ncbi:MAG: TetR/AcrR family transcriptional regulator [Gemmataceae bacterium]|nr:TetR/AcrR family transcriptional regulator [Gemmataceae bacterium]